MRCGSALFHTPRAVLELRHQREEDMTSTPKTRLLFFVNLFHQQLLMKCTMYQMLEYWIQQRERYTHISSSKLSSGSASATDLHSFPHHSQPPGVSPRLPGLDGHHGPSGEQATNAHRLWSHTLLAGVLTAAGSMCNPGLSLTPVGSFSSLLSTGSYESQMLGTVPK